MVNSQGLYLTLLPCPPPLPAPSDQEVTPAGRPEGVRLVSPKEPLSGSWASPAPPPPHRKAQFCPSAQQHRRQE